MVPLPKSPWRMPGAAGSAGTNVPVLRFLRRARMRSSIPANIGQRQQQRTSGLRVIAAPRDSGMGTCCGAGGRHRGGQREVPIAELAVSIQRWRCCREAGAQHETVTAATRKRPGARPPSRVANSRDASPLRSAVVIDEAREVE